MQKILIIAALAGCCLFTSAVPDPEPEHYYPKAVSTIAFGSCSHQENDDQMWPEINAEKPDVFIWLGDNIYGDTEDMDLLHNKYRKQKERQGYRQLMAQSHIIGVWDDHDYGVNDGGKEYAKKEESQQLMLDFLDVPAGSPERAREGVYSSHTYGPEGQRVKVILLDARYFRDPIERVDHVYQPNPTGDLLGNAQWAWLIKELANSDAQINLIGCGIQMLPEQHQWEKWANFPKERERLLEVIRKSGANGVILLSGDRHIAEISEVKLEGMDYPLREITSSGLTHTWRSEGEEPNRYRISELMIAKNYGMLEIDWNATPLTVTAKVKSDGQKVLYEATWKY